MYNVIAPQIIGAQPESAYCIDLRKNGPRVIISTLPSVFPCNLKRLTFFTFAPVNIASVRCDNSWCITPINVNLVSTNVANSLPKAAAFELTTNFRIKVAMLPSITKISNAIAASLAADCIVVFMF